MDTIQKPISSQFEPTIAEKTRTIVMAASLIIIVVFTYLSYLAWSFTRGTQLEFYSLLVMLPVVIGAGLFVFLVTLGQKGFRKEYAELKRYKVKFSSP